VELNQPRLIQRAIRQNANIRKYITAQQLRDTVDKFVPATNPMYDTLVQGIAKLPVAPEPSSSSGASGEEKSSSSSSSSSSSGGGSVPMDLEAAAAAALAAPTSIFPEVEVFIFTTLVTSLLREKLDTDAAFAATALVDRIRSFNRRSLDQLSSKAFFYFSLAYERVQRLENIRPTLLALYRTSCVRRDEMGQAVLLNLLLRNYLHYNLIEQAQTLSLRAAFPENASNNQFCRYLYYMGRVQATQLEYSDAYQRLMMAVRKVLPKPRIAIRIRPNPATDVIPSPRGCSHLSRVCRRRRTRRWASRTWCTSWPCSCSCSWATSPSAGRARPEEGC
jgi:26S proteasome regulatory subunit N3